MLGTIAWTWKITKMTDKLMNGNSNIYIYVCAMEYYAAIIKMSLALICRKLEISVKWNELEIEGKMSGDITYLWTRIKLNKGIQSIKWWQPSVLEHKFEIIKQWGESRSKVAGMKLQAWINLWAMVESIRQLHCRR